MTDTDAEPMCPYKLRWGLSQEATSECGKEAHVGEITITEVPEGFTVIVTGDPSHIGEGLFRGQTVRWQAGDRREYIGDWPGYCDKIPKPPFEGGCVLPLGHHGRCAP